MNDSTAYPQKELYLDIHSGPPAESLANEDSVAVRAEEAAVLADENGDSGSEREADAGDPVSKRYTFEFLTAEEAIARSNEDPDKERWFRVKDVLKYRDQSDLMTDLYHRLQMHDDEQATRNLSLLYDRLTNMPVINFYNAQSNNMDEVLDIFVRINSGGTVLSRSDLIFSTIVSSWEGARDSIDHVLKVLNGDDFSFSKDFVLRTALYVLDFPARLQVKTFTSRNVEKIRNHWDKIVDALKETVALLRSRGLNGQRVTSYNALIPIVYFVYHSPETQRKESSDELIKYYIAAQINQLFGSASNTVLENVRRALKDHTREVFDRRWFEDTRFSGGRRLWLTPDDLSQIVDRAEKGPVTFLLLSLLYPNLRYDTTLFHQDHMHPYSSLTKEKLKKLKKPDGTLLTDDEITEWTQRRNTLPNLQLLEGSENIEKRDVPLEKWLRENSTVAVACLPEDVSYALNHFDDFYRRRKELMVDELAKIL